MRELTAVIERCPDTGLFVGYIPDFPAPIRKGKRSRNCEAIWPR
jgi:predicted RNase H-like HicB family nuclease